MLLSIYWNLFSLYFLKPLYWLHCYLSDEEAYSMVFTLIAEEVQPWFLLTVSQTTDICSDIKNESISLLKYLEEM